MYTVKEKKPSKLSMWCRCILLWKNIHDYALILRDVFSFVSDMENAHHVAPKAPLDPLNSLRPNVAKLSLLLYSQRYKVMRIFVITASLCLTSVSIT